MLRSIGLIATTAVLWLLLSGYWDVPLLLGFGAASALLVTYIAHRMDVVDHETVPLHLAFGVTTYWFWLFREIAKANIDVVRAIFSDLSEVKPKIIDFDTGLKTDMGKVILANSITLSPGTVTVELIGDRLTVHALTEAAADPRAFLEMEKRIARMEART